MVKVHGMSTSGNCHKVRMVLEALKLPYAWTEVDTRTGATHTPAFLAMNPNGRVPVAEVEPGVFLPESNAIMGYLADGSPLLPGDRLKKARVMQWLFFEQYSHEPAIAVRRALRLFLRKGDDEIDPELWHKGRRALGRMELQLIGSAFLVGEAFTLADIALVAYTRVAHEGGFDLSEFPAVHAWIHRVENELGLAPAMEVV
jgi:glutathione S-transferase